MSVLKIAPGFELPLEVVTEATAIVATRGAGKSSASAVVVEESFPIGVQSVIFDRTGVYWGLRSSKTGKGPGLGIYVLGGPHGDVPLEPHAGAMIADLVVDSGHSFVLDLSDLSKSAAVRFAADFLERLYDRKARSRSTTLLVIDEAHFYAPQTPRGGFKGDAARLMGAMEDVVGLGRSRGLGVVLTTQRTQSLNKAVLDLIETLIVMRMLSPRARGAVRDWIQEKHEEDELGVIASLDSLPTGTAWVWSPLRGILEKIAIRRISTFDSYATPKGGEVLVEPQRRAELDLAALGEQMAATVERAKENDPGELRKRVAVLQRQLAERPAEVEQVEVVREVEVPALSAEAWARLERTEKAIEEITAGLVAAADEIRTGYQGFAAAIAQARSVEARRPAPTPAALPGSRPAPEPVKPARPSYQEDVGANGSLSTTARKILEAIVRHHPAALTPSQVALSSQRKARGGSWNTAVSELRRGGYIQSEGATLVATERAFETLGVPAVPLGPKEQLKRWRESLPATAASLFDILLDVYPNRISAGELAARTGRKPVGGSWNTAVSTLTRNDLADRNADGLRATDWVAEGR